jgi:hypothetical protein
LRLSPALLPLDVDLDSRRMEYRVSYEDRVLGSVRLVDGEPMVDIADDNHRRHMEEVFDLVRGSYDREPANGDLRFNEPLFNAALDALRQGHGYSFERVDTE